MKWVTVDMGDVIHVLPELDDGYCMFHVADDCLCEPRVEQYRRRLVCHRALTEHPHRRYILRAWNLRRMLRGRRGGIR